MSKQVETITDTIDVSSGSTLTIPAGSQYQTVISSNTTIQIGSSTGGGQQLCNIVFKYTSGTITFNISNLKWVNNVTPTFSSGKVYDIIFKKIGSSSDLGTPCLGVFAVYTI